ncbi:hypothetical protein [Nocardiopsis ganjiahuensis]|uniref:hypothetical protein n=1 Tax=Nocardiopsis ganjiahuensis TaxID=239984 RepID=UPI001267EA52|nr:hypothetical protein [Nocardiopsis ganjiahuensis]
MPATQSSGDASSSRKRPWTAIGSAGAALTVIAAGGLFWWDAQGADHVTTGPLDEHPLARTASGSAWEWAPPEDAEVAAVRPIPSGVAVQLDDGVIALDGVTGEPTWRYRRPETALTAAGEIVGEQEIEENRHSRFVNNPTLGPGGTTQHLPASGVYQLTNDARIELLASEFTARSLTDGTVLWKPTGPNCTSVRWTGSCAR